MSSPVSPDPKDIGPGWDPSDPGAEAERFDAVAVLRHRSAQGMPCGSGQPRFRAIGPETEAIIRHDSPTPTRPGSRGTSKALTNRRRVSVAASLGGLRRSAGSAEIEFENWKQRVGGELDQEISEEEWLVYMAEGEAYMEPSRNNYHIWTRNPRFYSPS